MVSSLGFSCRSSPRISAPICWVSGTRSSRALVIATIDGIEAEKTAGELQNDGVLPAGGTPAERFLTRVKKGIEVRRRDSSAGGARRCLRAAFWSGLSRGTASLQRGSRDAGSSPRGVGDRWHFRGFPLRV